MTYYKPGNKNLEKSFAAGYGAAGTLPPAFRKHLASMSTKKISNTLKKPDQRNY